MIKHIIYNVLIGIVAVAYSLDGKLIARLAFSPDGKQLMTQNEDGTTWIYMLDTEKLIVIAKSRLTHR